MFASNPKSARMCPFHLCRVGTLAGTLPAFKLVSSLSWKLPEAGATPEERVCNARSKEMLRSETSAHYG